MTKLSKLGKKLKDNSFARIIIELIILVILFNVNEYLGLGLLLVILFEIIISKDIGNLISIFLFLSFNDEILKLDLLRGSISRIVLVLLVIKLLYYIIKNKPRIQKKHYLIAAFFAVSCLVNISNIVEEGIVLLNFLIWILFSICALHGIKDKDKFIEKICITIVASVISSIVYGLITANFLEYVQNEKTMYRFNGSYEPNFMCMYINLAIFSLITIKDKFKKWIYYLIFAFLINSVLLTMSITGILTLGFGMVIYYILFHKKWKEILVNLAFVVVLSGAMFLGVKQIDVGKYVYWVKHSSVIDHIALKNENIDIDDISDAKETNYIDDSDAKETNYIDDSDDEKDFSNEGGIEDRFSRIKNLFVNGKIDELTSGRTALARTFIKASFNRPWYNVLFGNNLLTKKVYSDFFDRDCYSHNSFVDFLYNFGIVGFCIIVGYIGYVTIKNRFMNMDISTSLYVKNIKIIRIMLILFALSLTLYTKRMFLIFFLL